MEDQYQKALEVILGGKHLQLGCFGITDITTDLFHAEIKEWKSWKFAVGQLLSYQFACNKDHLRVYLFGKLAKNTDLCRIIQMFESLNIIPFSLAHTTHADNSTQMIVTNLVSNEIETYDVQFNLQKANELSEAEKKFIILTYEKSLKMDKDALFIKLDDVGELLHFNKDSILKCMKKMNKVRFKDYDFIKPKDHVKKDPRCNHFKVYIISLSCFEWLCLHSHAPNAKNTRTFIHSLQQSFAIRHQNASVDETSGASPSA